MAPNLQHGYLSQKNENLCLYKNPYTNIHSISIHNSPNGNNPFGNRGISIPWNTAQQ